MTVSCFATGLDLCKESPLHPSPEKNKQINKDKNKQTNKQYCGSIESKELNDHQPRCLAAAQQLAFNETRRTCCMCNKITAACYLEELFLYLSYYDLISEVSRRSS
ncbi:hypothetical protein OS493_007251 [Desmophyllum pertusum]|uniref:Uncharacterized protein n=1 Tax=Desmophyllum pertusum TaxID=174260 RepID=A0A9W9ZHV0_9CNID|nr:hypothetical protein OS493_007251 [Desmophyllum pertusum]